MRIFVGILVMFLSLFAVSCAEDPAPHVGSQDCVILDEIPMSSGLCSQCQGQACEETCGESADADCVGCEQFPCVDGVRVVQGCDADSDCAEFEGMYCGLGISQNKNLCGLDMGDM